MVTPSRSGNLLGITINEDLKWKEHLINGEKGLVKSLTLRVNALKKISTAGSFKTRLMVANACFISVLSYMIIIWGGTEKYLIRTLQVIQNKAARCVTKLTWFTPTRTLLRQCNWLSVQQLIFYHTAIQMWKIRKYELPVSLHDRFHLRSTRSGSEGALTIPPSDTSLAKKSFSVRAAATWNQIPVTIRNTESFTNFKRNLKQWVLVNIPIE